METAARPGADTRPNIVVILADDMGYSTSAALGSESRRRARQPGATGVRFAQFYNCARCARPAASLLTGLYPHQAGVAT